MADIEAPQVRLDAVCHAFDEGDGARRVVLDGVTAQLRRAESVAILGRSGSGKSTLLNLIGGLDVADRGRIEVAGVELGALSETERTRFRRRRCGFVFQSFHLLPTLTVLENILLPRELDGRVPREVRDRARGLLDRTGLGDRADAYPDVLSGGEQQRVALARAVLGQPELLLADEPTGNLDETSAETVLELLVELGRDHGCTVVMATHSRTAAARCERVLRIENAALIEAPPAPEGR